MVKKEHLAAKIFRNLTWHFPGRANEIFLTFDDGPTPEITPWVLSILKEYNAKATFFCLGSKVEKYPQLYNQILTDGHLTGNHSYSHFNGWNTNNYKYYNDIKKASAFIDSKLFRPPYGKISLRQINHLKYHYQIIMWDVLSYDFYSNINPQKCLRNVIKGAQHGSIIVFHDNEKSKSNLKYVLPRVLLHFANLGFSFNPIVL
ncbi:MAG: polysaccharide deacetylase family protein [Thiohalospira sp.]